MPYGDTREFLYRDRQCRVTVSGAPDSRDEKPGIEWVEISFPSSPDEKPLRRAMYSDTLSEMAIEELAVMVGIAEHRALQGEPHSPRLLAFVRLGEEFVLSRGEWQRIRAIGAMSGCTVDDPGFVSRPLSGELASVLIALAEKFDAVQRERTGLIWPATLPDFLQGGGFSIRELPL